MSRYSERSFITQRKRLSDTKGIHKSTNKKKKDLTRNSCAQNRQHLFTERLCLHSETQWYSVENNSQSFPTYACTDTHGTHIHIHTKSCESLNITASFKKKKQTFRASHINLWGLMKMHETHHVLWTGQETLKVGGNGTVWI